MMTQNQRDQLYALKLSDRIDNAQEAVVDLSWRLRNSVTDDECDRLRETIEYLYEHIDHLEAKLVELQGQYARKLPY